MIPGYATAKELVPELPLAKTMLGYFVTDEVPRGFMVFQDRVTGQLFCPAGIIQAGFEGERVPDIGCG